jgi:C-terminal processing protease CtpA/Prc
MFIYGTKIMMMPTTKYISTTIIMNLMLLSLFVTDVVTGQDAPTRSPDFGSIVMVPIFGNTKSPGVQPIPTDAPVVAVTPTIATVPTPVTPSPTTLPPGGGTVSPPPTTLAPVGTGTPTTPTATAPVVAPVTPPPTTLAPVGTGTPTTVIPSPVASNINTTTTPVPGTTSAPTNTTLAPAGSPVPNVTFVPIPIEAEFKNNKLIYPNVSHELLSDDNITTISTITEEWYVGFYNNSIKIENFTTSMNITEHGLDNVTSGTYIMYDQVIQYEQVSEDAKNATYYALLPFNNTSAVETYTELLSNEIPAFANVGTIAPPIIGSNGTSPVSPPVSSPVSSPVPGDDGLSGGAIAGIVIGIIVFIGVIVGGAVLLSSREPPKGHVSNSVASSADKSLAQQSAANIGGGAGAVRSMAQVENGLFVVYAPAGKLGFSLDQPDSGPLIIYVVKDESPLINLTKNGDRVVAVDEVNVRKSSPARVVGLLKERMQSPWRKLTLIRNDESTINDPEGQYVVYAPSEKLGFSLEKTDESIPPVVRVVKDTSILFDTVEVGDQLHYIDEVDIRNKSAKEGVALLKDRSSNPIRKLTFLRVMPTETELAAGGEYKYNEGDAAPGDEGLVIAFAPAGGLGFSLQSPDASAMVVHSIKEGSPLVDQVKTGDRLIGVDDIDVRALSPSRVVNLLSTRKTNAWRKLTLVRHGAIVPLDESSIQLEEGTFVVYVPSTKLGFSLNSMDDGPPVFQIVKDDSILSDTARVGDRLLRIDEYDTTQMHAGKAVKILAARKDNPYRKLIIQRGAGSAPTTDTSPDVPVVVPPPTTLAEPIVSGDTYTVKAPAGKLGVILDNPDEGSPVIHTVKDTSPLLGQITVGDRLVMIDDVDVSDYSPAQVVQLLSTKSQNPVRLLTLSHPSLVSQGSEPEIVVTDGESTVTGGEYIEGDDEAANKRDNE